MTETWQIDRHLPFRTEEIIRYGEILDEMLRDCIVCGIADGHLQRRLLAEPELTLLNWHKPKKLLIKGRNNYNKSNLGRSS